MILGIIIAVGALSLSMILFESYEETLSQAFKASQPDIVIVNNSQEITSTQEAKLNSILAKYKNDIRAIANRKKLSVIISRNEEKSPAYLEGFYQENSAYNSFVYPFSNIKGFQLEKNQIILGQYLAKELNAQVGDTIQVILPSSIRYSIFGLVNQSQDLIVKDVYKTGLYDIDLTRAIVSSDKLLTLSGKKLKDSDYSLILNQRNSDKSSEITSQLNRDFMTSLPILYAHDVISSDSSIFAALTLQKMMIFLILCIIIIVASFNVISTISTIINEKIEEIGILMTLGLKRSQIKLLYYIFSLLLTHIGIILGLLVGYSLAYLLTHQDYFTLKADIYFIDKIMISPSFSSLILIYGTTLFIMSVTILLSLRSINKLEIIKILRR